MIKKLFLIALFLLSAGSCLYAQQAIPKDTLITLKRSGCLGFCPPYTLTVKADGAVEFMPEDKDFKGKVIKSRISKEKMKRLLAEFEKIGFFSLDDDYTAVDTAKNPNEPNEKNCPQMWTDHVTVITTLTTNGKSKTITHYHGCEGIEILTKLMVFENAIDEIVGTGGWTDEISRRMYERSLKP